MVAGDASAAISAFRRAIRPGEEQRALQRIGDMASPRVAMGRFEDALERARDVRAALRDPRVLGVIGTALGIPEAATQPGLAVRALTSDPADRRSVVNTLPDRRWKAAAETLRLHARGLDGLKDPKVQEQLAEGLRRAEWRRQLEQRAPGLGDAMLFRERAATGVSNTFELLGNPVLRRVVTTALGLPPQLALQSVEAQARAVEARLDVGRLRNPAEAQRLVERYLIARAGEAQPDGAGAGLPGVLLSVSA